MCKHDIVGGDKVEFIQVSWIKFKKFKPLIHELITRDLKVKYRRSFLGYLWSLLNPLLMMAIMSIVFSQMFKVDISNFPLYIICGQTLFSFFSESTTMAMGSILANASLIKKIYIPKYIFPFSRVLSSFVTMAFSLMAIFIVMIITGANFYWTILLIWFPVLFLFFFCCGWGMVLSSLSVYFRDMTYLWSVITLAWTYLTPVFYTVDLLPKEIIIIVENNPLYIFISFFRELVMNGAIPDVLSWIKIILCGILSLVIGLIVFKKLQGNFILYI
ncbi:MAG: ABC transporter permease [Clostridia bacterium]|nr:ABC transporter permease [Clostridia bacterium]